MDRSHSSLDADRPAAVAYKSQHSNGANAMVDVATDDGDSSARPGSTRKIWLLGGLALVVLAAGGVVAAVVLLKAKSSSQNTSNGASSGNPTNPPSTDAGLLGGGGAVAPSPNGNTNNGNGAATTPTNPASDPEAAVPVLTMLAIGDWGGTTGKEHGIPGSCCKLYKADNQLDTTKTRYMVDFYSQKYIATLLGQSAAQLSPARVISHGDNIYWNGLGSLDWQYRFQETFEKIYDAPSLQGVKWLNVAGNHDIGGSSFICGEQDNQFVECASTAQMLRYLNERFDLQAQYKSPNQDRWLMKDHYYVESVSKNGVTVDIFNLDTNYADSHGARQVCCQCYGYSAKYGYDSSKCNDVNPGDKACAGGSLDMYNTCMAQITDWATDSYTKATRDIAASTATFKIVNTHYSPHFHMTPDKMLAWYTLCKNTSVSAWFNGHTHGFNHDIANWGTHFFENGGGGGIVTETSTVGQNPYISNAWVGAGTPYGFMELSFSKDWLKVQFVTFDKAWTFGGLNYADTVPGGIQRGHCWFVPSVQYSATGAKGVACKSSVDGAIGAPIR
ncbi:Aste57867_6924 [Aphanomyces stellatus]|uniref:Aste57867_6924 protein n=1 Tax=Aphanomyces stellatus TaxID=120398 RepID=A0A485KGR3_9STRA|nr:hypothetical protein As57867_006902 [Aphanomyces stellatus]VFT83876.1 Aste57867_6924 [Aphanomyces stellatus]